MTSFPPPACSKVAPLRTEATIHLIRRRLAKAARVAALALGLSSLLHRQAFAGDELDVLDGQSDLTLATTYSEGTAPVTTSDVTFGAMSYTTTAYTAASALSINTLSDLDPTDTLGITGAGTITLNGGTTNSVASVSGGDPADLLYVASAGTLNIANPMALGVLGNFDTFGTLNLSTTATSIISGNGGINKTGTGTMTIGSGSVSSGQMNSYTGGTTVTGGTLRFASLAPGSNSNITPFGSGLITVNAAGILKFNSNQTTNNFYIPNSVTLDGGSIYQAEGSVHLGKNYAGTTVNPINITANGATIAGSYTNKNTYLDGIVTGSGPISVDVLAVNSTGESFTAFTNNSNTYNGIVTIKASTAASGSGTLGGGGAILVSSLALSNATVVTPGGDRSSQITYTSNTTNVTFGALSGGKAFTLPTGTLTVGSAAGVTTNGSGNGNSTIYTGVMSGTGGFTKDGTGMLALTGANSYSGQTQVTNGTLLVNGTFASTATGLVTVGTSGTLGGSGTLIGAVTVNGTLSPGGTATAGSTAINGTFAASVGRLTTGALTLASTANCAFDIASATSFDSVNAGANAAIFGGTLTINLGTFKPTSGSNYDLFDFGSGLGSGTFSSIAFSTAGYAGTFDNTSGILTISVPEPATNAGVLLGLAAVVYGYRRRAVAA